MAVEDVIVPGQAGAAGCTFTTEGPAPTVQVPLDVLGKVRQQAVDHAVTGKEACGVLVARGQRVEALPCPNRHPEPHRAFAIGAEHWAAAEELGTIVAIYHSHPTSPAQLTPVDEATCKEHGKPYLVYSVPWCRFLWYEPEGREVPLLGRPWEPGVFDCYTFVRDYYRQKLGIEFQGGYEYDEFWYINQPDRCLWEANLEREGFVQVDPAARQPHDLLLMGFGHGRWASHAAVYASGGRIVHHSHGRLSASAPYGTLYRQATRMVVRHKSLAGG